MVVLDQFYQIVEKKTEQVSQFWKAAHVFTCFVSAVCGFLTAVTFGRVLDNFNYNCMLNAHVVFDNVSISNASKSVRRIDFTSTVWGADSDCSLAQFVPLVIMISAVVWGVYFSVLSKGGAGYPTDILAKSWTILYPCILFTAVLFIVYVISTLKLKKGMQNFCAEFHTEFNTTECNPGINEYAEQFIEDAIHTRFLFYDFYPNTLVALISADIGVWSWVVQVVLCVTRIFCVADFDLQLVTIMSKDEEEEQSVVEFADMDEINEVSEV